MKTIKFGIWFVIGCAGALIVSTVSLVIDLGPTILGVLIALWLFHRFLS